jgi:Na+/H+-translocating membrane pyrophosphatase
MILGATLAHEAGFSHQFKVTFMLFPLVVHCLDILSSTIGMLFVRTTPGLPGYDSIYRALEDPIVIMKRAYKIAMVVGLFGFFFICHQLLNPPRYPDAWMMFGLCGLVGMAVAYLFIEVTQYYTDYQHDPVRRIALASRTGHATNIIAGLSVGMESTGLPVLIISVGVLTAYYLGEFTGIRNESGEFVGGLFGTAIATMGMFCTGVYILSMSGFGPIADNAGGIAEMSGQPEEVRAITDRLDAVGNVTKANAKVVH